MFILCKTEMCVIESKNVFQFYIEENSIKGEWTIMCVPSGDVGLTFIMCSYSSESHAYDALCNMLTIITNGTDKYYILLEDDDFE